MNWQPKRLIHSDPESITKMPLTRCFLSIALTRYLRNSLCSSVIWSFGTEISAFES